MSGGFLDRWSRRKRAAAEVPPADEAETVAPAPADDQTAPAPQDEAEVEALIAALPPVESLTPQSDIRMFLQRGVPAALRNAALRRMWSLDPVISTHQDVARDYAWDWNTPGGVPGHGGPLSSESVTRMAERFLGSDPAEDASPAATAPAEPSPAPAAAPEGDGQTPPPAPAQPAQLANIPAAATAPDQAPDPRPGPAGRRHGKAKPA